MEPFVFIAEEEVPELGIHVGERVVVRPGAKFPVVVQRDLPPNYGLILLAAEAGQLSPLTPAATPAALRAVVGLGAPPPRSLRPRPQRWLSILR